MEKRTIRAVLFDLDDTLIDWSKKEISGSDASRHHLNNVHIYLQHLGHQLPTLDAFCTLFRQIVQARWDEAKKDWSGVHFGSVMVQTIAAAGVNTAVLHIDDILQAYDWQPIPGIVPFDDTIAVLDNLQQNQYKLGLITNSMQPMWMRDIELEAYGLLPYFAVRTTSGDTGVMKPHPQIYWQTLKRLGVSPQEAMFVGDRPGNDVLGANEAGMVSVWMDPPHLERELEGIEPHYRITQLSELLPILRDLSA